MARGKVLGKEFPFLVEHIIPDMFYQVRKFGPDVLRIELWRFTHSWAGTQGTRGWVITHKGEKIELPCGIQYSDNGRIVRDEDPIPVWMGIDMLGIAIDQIGALIINEWDRFNDPSQEFDDWVVYVRPNREKLQKEFERLVELEKKELLASLEK